jgi:hypothetical protein
MCGEVILALEYLNEAVMRASLEAVDDGFSRSCGCLAGVLQMIGVE